MHVAKLYHSFLTKLKYLEACNAVKSMQEKVDKSSNNEKLNKTLHQLILDMNNSKNISLLSIESANKGKAKYYDKDIPKFLLGLPH
jgi:hypothetical protein